MGKKRRLLHSKKFAAKHNKHPRMKLLNHPHSPEVTKEVTKEVVETMVMTTPTLTEPPQEISPEVVVGEITPAAPRLKAGKTTPTRKKTTKKTTSTRKRTTKAKTKATTP